MVGKEHTTLMLIKIQSWILKPKVWSFMCCVSSVVGMLCYALSSSFNDLYGKWTWWKILLYIVFSSVISLAVLSTKAWERSISPCVQVHTSFSILLITSVYSFFFDKEVRGKPDAYSLVSYAAFAVMSLGLSRLSHFGFDVDLLYFFSGVLTIQLMKIKLWLIIVGGGFSYSLILLRSTLDSIPRAYHGLGNQDQVVIEIDHLQSQVASGTSPQVDSAQSIITSTGNYAHPMATTIMPIEADYPAENTDQGFLVPQLSSHSQQSKSDSDNSAMARFMGCIEALKKENANLINTISKHVEKYLKSNPVMEIHADNNLVVDVLPLRIINDLHEAAMLMLTAGFEEDCWKVYSCCRREFLKECIWTFGLQMQELNMEDIGKIEKIRCWLIKALHIADNILFPNERRLCDQIFKGASSSANIAFTVVCRELTISLLRIANHLVTFLDCENFRYEGGELHPVIHELMNKIHSVSVQRDSIFRQGSEKHTMVDKEGKLSPSALVTRIIVTELLERILEADSKNYNDPTLGYVFVMNNRNFIEHEAKVYGLVPIFGQDWLGKNTTKFQKNLELYLRSSWSKIVDILKQDINESEPNVAAKLMKDKLHSFNILFDDICNVQSTWLVIDNQLREQIIKSIENILMPAYGNFIGRFQDFFGKLTYEYIKYGIFDVQDRVNSLFIVREYKNLRLYQKKKIPKC